MFWEQEYLGETKSGLVEPYENCKPRLYDHVIYLIGIYNCFSDKLEAIESVSNLEKLNKIVQSQYLPLNNFCVNINAIRCFQKNFKAQVPKVSEKKLLVMLHFSEVL